MYICNIFIVCINILCVYMEYIQRIFYTLRMQRVCVYIYIYIKNMKITQSYFIRALVSDFPENKYILWTMWVLTNPQRLPLKHTTLNHFNKNFASKLNKVKVECLF